LHNEKRKSWNQNILDFLYVEFKFYVGSYCEVNAQHKTKTLHMRTYEMNQKSKIIPFFLIVFTDSLHLIVIYGSLILIMFDAFCFRNQLHLCFQLPVSFLVCNLTTLDKGIKSQIMASLATAGSSSGQQQQPKQGTSSSAKASAASKGATSGRRASLAPTAPVCLNSGIRTTIPGVLEGIRDWQPPPKLQTDFPYEIWWSPICKILECCKSFLVTACQIFAP
jgi:hypothetical protein